MGHAPLFRAWPEEVRAGNKFPDFAGFSAVRPGFRGAPGPWILRAHEGRNGKVSGLVKFFVNTIFSVCGQDRR